MFEFHHANQDTSLVRDKHVLPLLVGYSSDAVTQNGLIFEIERVNPAPVKAPKLEGKHKIHFGHCSQQ